MTAGAAPLSSFSAQGGLMTVRLERQSSVARASVRGALWVEGLSPAQCMKQISRKLWTPSLLDPFSSTEQVTFKGRVVGPRSFWLHGATTENYPRPQRLYCVVEETSAGCVITFRSRLKPGFLILFAYMLGIPLVIVLGLFVVELIRVVGAGPDSMRIPPPAVSWGFLLFILFVMLQAMFRVRADVVDVLQGLELLEYWLAGPDGVVSA
jgi:hypothetical protein